MSSLKEKLKLPRLIKEMTCNSVRSTLHEGIRHQLWTIGEEMGMTPLAEFKITFEAKGYRRPTRIGKLDLVWIDQNGEIDTAFEIDFSWKKKSLFKLKDIQAKNKVWVVFTGQTRTRKPKPDLAGVETIEIQGKYI